ncbi:MAG: hypothetical protein K6E10_12865, partial [Eubacterium sp.]|nr:hypothetical protein [Eubacterium sp.]
IINIFLIVTGLLCDMNFVRMFKKRSVYKLYNKYFKRAGVLCLLFLLLFSLYGCGASTKVIESEDMSITIGKEYKKETLANATWYYASPDGMALGIRSLKDDVEKSGLEVDSASDYAEAYIKANSIPNSPSLSQGDGYEYFEYTKKVSGTEFSYITFVYDNYDEYWIVSFACYKELYTTYKKDFIASADSVEFSKK